MVWHLVLTTWDEYAELDQRTHSNLSAAALSYITQNYVDASLAPAQVADAVGVSVRTLQESLANEGTSPAQKITELRLNHAAQYLADPTYQDTSITDIARLSGFSLTDTFRRSFTRRFGIPPSTYRARFNPDNT